MSEKIVGYALLFLGITIIAFAGINVYQVFTSNQPPISLFNLPPLYLDMTSIMSAAVPNLPPGSSLKTEILPASTLNQFANIFAHLMLMGFILNVGQKLALLGVYLLRSIKVQLKSAPPGSIPS